MKSSLCTISSQNRAGQVERPSMGFLIARMPHIGRLSSAINGRLILVKWLRCVNVNCLVPSQVRIIVALDSLIPGSAAKLIWLLIAALAVCGGCVRGQPSDAHDVLVWGKRGLNKGRFQKPRALAIDSLDRLYIADKTGFIQSFDRDGKFITSWRLPDSQIGLPCGLSNSNDGKLLVADTHYFRILTYTPEGELLGNRTIGGKPGHGPGEFGFVTDVIQDTAGNYYVSEYGEFDRIQKFNAEGKYVMQWGSHGDQPGQFLRPQSLVFDDAGQLWVADACNHRLQVFDLSSPTPTLVKILGAEGTGLGQLRYPYSIVFDPQGNFYVCEMGNHRIQHWRPDGSVIGSWGAPGKGPGELNQPWAIALDSQGDLHVLDTHNHRVQRIRF